MSYFLLKIVWKFWHPRSEGAFVALWCRDKLLVVKHSYKRGFCLPGGGLHANETYLEAAARELREETGVNVQHDQLSEPIFFHLTDEGKDDHVGCFEYKLVGEPPITNIDCREIVWSAFVDPDTLPGHECNTLLKIYLEQLE